VDVVHCPPISKTKGQPKRRRCKGGKELPQNKNNCGLCKANGHNIVTCPVKDDVQNSNQVRKRNKMLLEMQI